MTSIRSVLNAVCLASVLAGCTGKVTSAASVQGAPSEVTVGVAPADAEVRPRGAVVFAATVLGTAETAVTWTIEEGAAGGSIDASGLYTAGPAAGVYHVVVTSAADPTKSATATVTVTATPAVTIAVTPAVASLVAGGTATFAATVTGAANGAVSWSVLEGSGCGTVSAAGVYSAPSAAATCHVVATSAADPGRSGAATVTVTAAPVVTVAVAPGAASVVAGGTATFAATVTGTTNGAVSWSMLEGSGCGSVSAAGVYSAPSAAATCHVVATSVADPTKSARATVTVTATPSKAVLAISPSSHAFGSVTVGSASSPFAFTVTNSGGSTASNVYLALQTGAPFSLSGNGCGTSAARIALPAGGSCTFSAGFSPTAAAAKTDGARITYDTTSTTGEVATASISGTGQGVSGGGSEYHVGPGQAYTKIGDVPWYGLTPGSTVYIHYQATPYREKFLISTAGNAGQWIRVLGVPGPNGERPVISGNGATTSTNMRFHWTAPGDFQLYGLIHVAVQAGDTAPIPAYVEIAGLQLQDADQAYSFTGENGATAKYDAFAAGIYVRGAKHVLIRDNVITHCGLGVYTWTGGDGNVWWDSLQADTTIRGNYFYDNGVAGEYLQHQTYTESDGVVIEYNRYGLQRSGANGSQIKDRSAGTVVRYNLIEESTGYFIDLVEPENGWGNLGNSNPRYGQDFVYGNVFINKEGSVNLVHWAEDQGQSRGRHLRPNGRLYFYNNSILTLADQQYWPTYMFNETEGGYACGSSSVGRIDVRNNIFLGRAATAGKAANPLQWAYCGTENFDLGVNWISSGVTNWQKSGPGTVTGTGNLVSPANNDPGYLNIASDDLHLVTGSSAGGIGGALAPVVTNNLLGLDLTPTQQWAGNQTTAPRASSGSGSDLGAFQR